MLYTCLCRRSESWSLSTRLIQYSPTFTVNYRPPRYISLFRAMATARPVFTVRGVDSYSQRSGLTSITPQR